MGGLGVRAAGPSLSAGRDESSRHAALEDAFARVIGGSEVVAFGYARRAMMELLRAMEVGAGREILLSPLTCKVVPLALLGGGWVPRYVDVDPDCLNLDAGLLAARASDEAGAILFQHTYGLSAGAERVAEVADRLGLPLIEDCCHCLPLHRKGWKPGSVGDAALFSNNLLKPLPAGAGAFVATGDPALAAGVRSLRNQLRAPTTGEAMSLRATYGADRVLLWPRTYWLAYTVYHGARGSARTRALAEEVEREIVPTARQLTDFEVGRGLRAVSQLEAVDRQRAGCSDRYREALAAIEAIEVPRSDPGTPLFNFPVLVPDKPALLREARARSIEIIAWPNTTVISGVDDPSALPTLGYQPGDCPVAERVASRLIGLPTHPRTTRRHLDRAIRFFIERYGS